MRSDLLIPLDARGGATLQDQIRKAIVGAVAAGELPRGARAPSSRALAARLGVSRNTVVLAYQQLVAEGLLTGRERSGLFVAPDVAPHALGSGDVAGAPGETAAGAWRPRFKSAPVVRAPWRAPPDWARYPYPFIDGLIDPGLFPAAEWREASRRAAAPGEVADWAPGRGDADDPRLIAEIAAKVLPRRGIHARPEEILVTVGSQQALSIALGLFADRRSLVAVEEPGYADTRVMIEALGARVLPQPVDADGLVVDDRLQGADIIVVTPSHHYPTGVTLAMARRGALLRLAGQADAVIVEDDFESETGYFAPALPALRALPGGERVVYIASLSAVLGPALRLGFMVADARVIAEARRARRLAIKSPPLATQRAAAHFLGEGLYLKTLARTGRVLRERRLALGEALNHYLQRWVTIDPGAGGASWWVRGPEGLDAQALAREAEQHGILIAPPEGQFSAGTAPGEVFRLGVTGIPLERIRPGVALLADLIRRKLARGFDPASLAPVLAAGPALEAAMSGATLLCKTVYGAPCTIELLPGGAMRGRAGYADEERDEGRWWVEGDFWFRQWRVWAYGETSAYRPLIDGGRVQWLDSQGLAVDWAVYVPPGADPAGAANLAP